ncbi:MAG TPA: polysaccharide biosynthesis/export family protein [Hanamia sp.]|nr:polysaccharide biosynthesis/export family protein [Hanamia sp.]
MYRNFFGLAVIIFFSVFMSSCVSSKKVIYLNDISDTSNGLLRRARTDFADTIQKNDLLSIAIGGSNPEDLATLNSANGSVPGSTTSTSAKSIGYLVEADGKIQLPFLGRVQAQGLTRLELEDTLTSKLSAYTKNPVVNIKFLNYGYSVLGEVNHPGFFEMNNERTTILDAIAMANDLTIYGKRNDILVIREVNGKREFGRVNLLSKNIFKSPFFYLKTNDVVYVEPVNSKFLSRAGAPQYISIAAAAIGLVLAILTLSKL